MKALNKIFVLSLFVLLFVSCGSDNDNKTKESFTGTLEHIIDIKGFKNIEHKIKDEASINEMWVDHEVVPTVISGEIVFNGTSIQVTGLESGMVLKDFTLYLNNLKYEFGAVTYANNDLYTSSTATYFKNVFNSIINRKNLNVQIEYTPSEDMLDENVKLEIKYKGYFTYYK